jgi:hypothetical protein
MKAASIFESTRALIPDVRRAVPSPRSVSHVTARALALLSVLIGALEVAVPSPVAERMGLRGREPLLRRYGGREIAAGVAALAGFLGPAMWARIFGELLDLASARFGRRTDRHLARNISVAVGAVAGIALIDLCVAALLARRADR